ncbi:Ribonuclease HII [Bacillus sp. THAF10]|uniref:ribonuclease HII n=1 Tax=Bacillus sp. THAF10 TaxID=2587848 RepID=UPI00126818B7|nr:ribonuclease HII [Bacillus sp. THAF10]QFT88850.1 Ribonuclease HII [Bacillus sp. THAF10]
MREKSIKEIEAIIQELSEEDSSILNSLQKDERKGVQALLRRWEKSNIQEKAFKQQFEEMLSFERDLFDKGYRAIAGVDEVGRGPLAGPVVAAAVVLPQHFYLRGLTDSKKLSPAKRKEFYSYIKEHALSYSIGIIDSHEIDQINIYEATKRAMIQAINSLAEKPDYLLIDAMKLEITIPQTSIIKGDARSVSIAAASVLAKETRDRYMEELSTMYPGFGFERNMGYGTKEHLQALEEIGVTKEHRISFSPVKEMVRR